MGNFEKLVVLTVLFLSAIVLAVSLSSGDPAKDGLTPFEDAAQRAREDQWKEQDPGRLAMSAEGDRLRGDPATATGEGAPERPAVSPANAADPRPEPASRPAPVVVPTNAQGHPRALRTLQGLTPAPLDNYMVYTPAGSDTWASLAERFYPDATFVPLLRAANEDLERPRAGEAILVPVFDFRAAPRDHAPRQAAPARPVTGEAKPKTTKAYEVVEGDSLWKIASKVYGSGVRWMEIYDANKDVMSDPDALRLGMKLRIP